MKREPLRTEGDIAANVPAWFVALARRVAAMQGGRVYNLVVIIPPHGDPYWSVTGDTKLEYHCERTHHE